MKTKIKVINSSISLIAIAIVILGFFLSILSIFIISKHSSVGYVQLLSGEYKKNQSKQFENKIDQMLIMREKFKDNFFYKNHLKKIEQNIIDSCLPVGLIGVGKNKTKSIGNTSLKFSYDYLSQKHISKNWFFENSNDNYYIVNIERKSNRFFIVFENLSNFVNQDLKDNLTLDSLVFFNSENRYVLYNAGKFKEISSGLSQTKVKSFFYYLKINDWMKVLNNEILISYSLKYDLIKKNYGIVFGIFFIFLIFSFTVYQYGLNRNLGLVLKSLIIKMNDFTLSKDSNVILPMHRRDIVGDVIREFDKLVRSISQKNIEIKKTNDELLIKSDYLSKKMNEIKKLKDIIIKSLNTKDVDSMVKELTIVLKQVFNSYGVVLIRKTDDNTDVFHTFLKTQIDKSTLNDFISTQVGLMLSSNIGNSKAQYKEGDKIYSTITLSVKVKEKLLGYLIVFNEKKFKESELDVIITFNSQVAVVLENLRLYGEEETKNELENEFMDAQEIQDILINKGENARRQIGVETYYLPAINIGGDWFDAIKISDTKTLYMIADITGHGAASALITTMFSTYFKVFQEIFGATVFDKNRVSNLISGLNDVFVNLTDGVKNATFAIALYDKTNMTLDYLSAGHNSSYIYDTRKGKVKALQVKNVRLGDEKKVKYTSKKFDVNIGDTLFMYTDGLIENNLLNGKEFGKKRLITLLKNNLVENDEKNFKEVLQKDIEVNVDLKHLDDDVTFLVAKL